MGYDVDRFVSEVNEGLLCGICRDVLEDPLQAPCEHAFCSACIMAWLVQHCNCPEDRRPLSAPLLRPLFRYMKNDLERLQIRCINSQAGCRVVCSLDFIHGHEAECAFHTENCPSVGCNAMLARAQLAEHLRVCEFRRRQCPNGCGLPILSAEDASHNCVAELRHSQELLRSELVGRLEERGHELELLLDDQRRHADQQRTVLQSQIDALKSQVALALHDVQSLRESARRHEFEIEQAAFEKRRLFEVIAKLQPEKTASGLEIGRCLSRQSSVPEDATTQ